MGPLLKEAFDKIEVVTKAEHDDLLEKYGKLQERCEKLEQSDAGDLHQEITDLQRQLVETEQSEKECQEYAERTVDQFRQHMTESNAKLEKLHDMVTNLTKQRDSLLEGYHAEVMG